MLGALFLTIINVKNWINCVVRSGCYIVDIGIVTREINSIIDCDGKVIVRYTYDDWGKPVNIVTDGSTIGNRLKEINPFIYKGYFYDQEFWLYYLKSRYYDSELGRFISADSEVGSIGNIQWE